MVSLVRYNLLASAVAVALMGSTISLNVQAESVDATSSSVTDRYVHDKGRRLDAVADNVVLFKPRPRQPAPDTTGQKEDGVSPDREKRSLNFFGFC